MKDARQKPKPRKHKRPAQKYVSPIENLGIGHHGLESQSIATSAGLETRGDVDWVTQTFTLNRTILDFIVNIHNENELVPPHLMVDWYQSLYETASRLETLLRVGPDNFENERRVERELIFALRQQDQVPLPYQIWSNAGLEGIDAYLRKVSIRAERKGSPIEIVYNRNDYEEDGVKLIKLAPTMLRFLSALAKSRKESIPPKPPARAVPGLFYSICEQFIAITGHAMQTEERVSGVKEMLPTELEWLRLMLRAAPDGVLHLDGDTNDLGRKKLLKLAGSADRTLRDHIYKAQRAIMRKQQEK